ncbi:MAG: signal peptidase I [Patescibacteria group bacterium]
MTEQKFNDNFASNGDFSHNFRPSKWREAIEFVWETLKIALISLAIIIPVRYFLIQPFYVKGASMEPNFYDHEYLIIDEITYRFADPKRGDIVVFKYPKNPSQYFIKRIIGLPGEQIKIMAGKVYLAQKDGQAEVLPEDYLPADLSTNLPMEGYSEVILGADEYFLLGDNRDQSLDSRVFGPVKREFIVGRTWLRGWPFDRLTIFETPQYDL